MSVIKFTIDDISYKIDSNGDIWRNSRTTNHKWMRSIHLNISYIQAGAYSHQAKEILCFYQEAIKVPPHPVEVF